MVPLAPAGLQRALLAAGAAAGGAAGAAGGARGGAHHRQALALLLTLVLAALALRLEAARGMQVAEALHVDRLDVEAGAAVAAALGAVVFAGGLLAVTPGVDGKVLLAHFVV